MSTTLPSSINPAWLSSAFINGKWQALLGSETIELVSPATEEPICTLTLGQQKTPKQQSRRPNMHRKLVVHFGIKPSRFT